MNILQITPGTGNFHCGHCLRDVALVKELRRMGHDAVCMPLYLPLVTEDGDPSDGQVFMGGINVYLQQKIPLFKSTPRWVDNLLNRPGLLKWSARHSDMTSAELLGEMTLSMLKGEDGDQIKELNKMIDWLKSQPKPDIICLSTGLLAGLTLTLKRELGVPVACTLQGEDSFLDSLPEPYREQTWKRFGEQVRRTDALIAVSRYFRDQMALRLAIPEEKIHITRNGINLDGYTPRTEWPEPPAIGFMARMCAPKGLGDLVDAFIHLRTKIHLPDVRLNVAGAQTPGDQQYVKTLQAKLRKAGLADAVSFFPNISKEEKIRFLQGLTVLSVPATYGEGFGLYFLEALASGVPVVQPDHAAFPELIEDTGGGLLCQPNDPISLAETLAELITDRKRNEELAHQGRRSVEERYTVQAMARDVMNVYEGLTE